jgi:hypothetical protein
VDPLRPLVSSFVRSGGIEDRREIDVSAFKAVLAAVSLAVSFALSVETLSDFFEENDSLRTSEALAGRSTIVYLDGASLSLMLPLRNRDAPVDILLVSFLVSLLMLELSFAGACSVPFAFLIKVDGSSSSEELVLPLLDCARFLSVLVCHPPVVVGRG